MPTPFEFPLSYIESMMPNAATTTETVTGAMPNEGAPDSSAALLDLLSSLQHPTVPQPQQPKQWQRVMGALGDALGSMASVRAGGGPVPVGPFQANLRGQQALYEQRQAEAEQGRMETENRVRIGAFGEEQRAQRARMIRPLDAEKFRLEQDKAAETERYHTGLLNKPPETPNPEVERHNRETERLAREALLKGKALRPLPPGLINKIAEQSAAVEAATQAKKIWEGNGKPDLGFMFTHTPDRIANKKAMVSRRALTEALIPVRKYFMGSAVSEGEKSAAAPIIANLEAGLPPAAMEQALIGLINIAERARRHELETADMGGFDVSRFGGEPTDAPSQGPTVSGPGGRTLRVVIDENGDLKVEE